MGRGEMLAEVILGHRKWSSGNVTKFYFCLGPLHSYYPLSSEYIETLISLLSSIKEYFVCL